MPSWQLTVSMHQIGSLICNEHDKLMVKMTVLFLLCIHKSGYIIGKSHGHNSLNIAEEHEASANCRWLRQCEYIYHITRVSMQYRELLHEWAWNFHEP